MSYKLQAAIAVAVAGLSNASVAADDVYRLDDVVVTASRTAQTVDQALAPVTVITRDEIERSQASSVVELLNRTPGMQISTAGGPGSQASIFLRGTRTAQTLVLIDGHKLNSTNGNEAPLQYLDPDQIERIEIVRGSRSSLYGADAIGGVIQIFTRQGSADPKLRLKAGVGSRNTGEYGLNFSGESEGVRFNAGANFYETTGFDYTDSKDGLDGDKDGYRNKSIFSSLSKTFENNIDAGVRFSHSEGKNEYDHNGWGDEETKPYSDFSLTNVSSYISVPVNDDWSTKLDLGYGREKISHKEEGKGNTRETRYANSKRYSASWQNDVSLNDSQLLTAGLDYSNEEIDTGTEYTEDSRYNFGVFAQHLSTFERSDLQIGLRHDKNQRYGENTTGNIAWGFDLPHNLRLTPSYGTAFRAPTFMELYGGWGNPDLKAETSRNAEIELQGKLQSASWAVSVFQNDMDDMIVASDGSNHNVDKARIRGLELSAIAEIAGWFVRSNLTFLDPENKSGANKGKQLHRRATQLFNLDVDREFGKWSVGGTFRAQNESWNDPANKEKVAGFGTLDLRAGYQVTPELKAETKVVNVMDREYTRTKGYSEEPRGVFLTFIWSPKL